VNVQPAPALHSALHATLACTFKPINASCVKLLTATAVSLKMRVSALSACLDTIGTQFNAFLVDTDVEVATQLDAWSVCPLSQRKCPVYPACLTAYLVRTKPFAQIAAGRKHSILMAHHATIAAITSITAQYVTPPILHVLPALWELLSTGEADNQAALIAAATATIAPTKQESFSVCSAVVASTSSIISVMPALQGAAAA
jgi:hypothetical protein